VVGHRSRTMHGGRILIGMIVAASLRLEGAATAESVSALKARALRLYREGAYREALPLFDEVLRRHSRDFESYTKRGNIYLGLDQPESALADFDAAVRLTPFGPMPSSFLAIPGPRP
jgi:tetratricopeptide (TPR) repeat protein